MEFKRLELEAAQAAARPRKPQPAPPDPTRGSIKWFAQQEKLKNSS
jgi:hypothetical protein